MENGVNTANNNNSNRIDISRRKRVNRMKTAIIIVVILLIILPTIGCIILGIQVSRLQKQIKDLTSLHSNYELTYGDSEVENYAYAAERSTADVEQTYESDAIINNDEYVVGTPAIEDTLTEGDFREQYSNKISLSGSENSVMKIPKSDQAMNTENESLASNSIKDESNLDAQNINQSLEPEQTTGKVSSIINDNDKKEINSLNTGIYIGKKMYLTFDDGPSMYTDDILDILAEYDVKATFFVVGKTDKESIELYKRIVDEGHTLGMHSYSHVYKKIYNSVEDFDKDFTKLWKLLYDTTGYKPSVFRFPGGSDNLVNNNGMKDFIQYLNEASVVYFDWNVVSGDATGVEYTKEQLIDNVLNGVTKKETSIILMHDAQTKEATVDSLPELLEILISEGAEILPLDKEVPPIQMIKADSFK